MEGVCCQNTGVRSQLIRVLFSKSPTWGSRYGPGPPGGWGFQAGLLNLQNKHRAVPGAPGLLMPGCSSGRWENTSRSIWKRNPLGSDGKSPNPSQQLLEPCASGINAMRVRAENQKSSPVKVNANKTSASLKIPAGLSTGSQWGLLVEMYTELLNFGFFLISPT